MRVRGTQPHNPEGIHVDTDTVYVRSNAVFIDTEEFTGWDYDEQQYCKDEYIRLISEKANMQDEMIEDLLFNILPTIGGGL